uniref:Uncharacterized protein n=1 Tax=Tanacetum cinerariifolium TaxID=118510 RepID=A0A699K1F5_TANCI|nr:hypothetical protein [Tanacetum cinerariifolium]
MTTLDFCDKQNMVAYLKKPTGSEGFQEIVDFLNDEAVYEEWDDRVERAASLDAAHASGGSLRYQEAIGDSITQTRFEKVPTQPYDSPLPRVNILESDEGSITLKELTVICTTLSQKVESLEANLKQTKQVYGVIYNKLIIKVKELKKIVKTSKARRKAKITIFDDEEEFNDPSKQGRSMIEEINQDIEVTLVTPTQVSTQGEAHSQEDSWEFLV